MTDPLGDRMKMYESAEAGRQFMPLLPVLARIDGRAFHGYTKHMRRPFDAVFSRIMTGVTIALVTETNACVGYTQSDEISLAFYSNSVQSQLFFNGRIQKMCSQLAALATAYFWDLSMYEQQTTALLDRKPTFDARVWQVPNLTEAANCFIWREQDAKRNSIGMAASSMFSHKELQKKSCETMQEMMFQRGVNWNDYPPQFKRGTYVQRRRIMRRFTAAECAVLPPQHEAHSNPDLMVSRSIVIPINPPPLARMTNRIEFLFYGDDPLLENVDGNKANQVGNEGDDDQDGRGQDDPGDAGEGQLFVPTGESLEDK